MEPFSGETDTESSTEPLNTEPINCFSAEYVEDSTYYTLPTIIYKDYIDTIQHINDIINNNILIVKIILLPQVEYDKVIHYQVKACAAQFKQKR